MAVEAGVANRLDQPEPGQRAGGARFDLLVQLRIADRERHRHADRHLSRGVGDQRQIAAQQRALGQNRQRRARLGQRADNPGHQGVTALGALIGVGVGAQRNRLALPRPALHLAAQHVGDVRLDDDLGVEILAAVQVQVLVGGPGEAVPAGMRTAPVPVDGVLKRQHRGARDFVQRGLAEHFVEGDAVELRCPHATDEADALQARQRAVVDVDALADPTAYPIRTHVRIGVKPEHRDHGAKRPVREPSQLSSRA